MAKEDEHIDQLFKEGIQKDYPYDESLWSKVSNKLPTNKGKAWFGLGRYISVVVILSILSFSSLLISDKSDHPRSNNHKTNNSENIKSYSGNALTENAPNENVFFSEFFAFKKIDLQPNRIFVKPLKIEEKISSSPNSNISKAVKSQITLQEENNFAQKTEKSLEAPDETQVHNNGGVIDISSSVNHSNEISKNDIEKTAVKNTESKDKNLALVDPVPNNAEIGNRKMTDDSRSVNQQTNPKETVNTNNFLIEEWTADKKDMEFIKPKGLFVLTMEEKAKIPPFTKLTEEEIYPWQKRKNTFIFEIEIRRSLHLSKKFEVDNARYKEYKQKFEKPWHQYNFGINAIKSRKNFTYGVGIHYESIEEKISFRTESVNLEFDTSYSMIDPSYNHNGELIYIIRRNVDSIATISHGKRINNSTNITRVQLPIFAGYKISYSSWSLEARTGLSLGYLIESSGSYLSPDFENTVQLNEENVSKFEFSHQVQLRFSYALDEYTAIGISGDYRYELNSSLKLYENRFSSYGGMLFIQINPFE